VVERTFRAEVGRVHALLAASYGDLGLAEDATQDAFAEAIEAWPRRGIPDNPGAWITVTARRRAIDRLRREGERAGREAAAHDGRAAVDDLEQQPVVADDQLRLVFTCCHPALKPEAQVALTLRLVCGLRTAEIARAFLVPEATVAQRLVRAKAKVRDAGIPLRLPPPHRLPERLPHVLACAYLVFTEGYASSSGPLMRSELCDEAIRLARLLAELMPDEPEVHGLLALLLLQDSRRSARMDAQGRIVLLEDQDRAAWDRASITAGLDHLERARRRHRPGPYQLQAAIAAVHARARAWLETDWDEIAGLYGELARSTGSPIVEVNRAIAVGLAAGPSAGLALLEAVAGDRRLARTHHLAAARADLLRRLGRRDEAATEFLRAAELAPTTAEVDHLRRRAQEASTVAG
jgi:RNA polymerase sigma-70 factor (ECF subfamily)